MSHSFRTDHATMRAITGGLRQMANQVVPPPADALSDARWQLFYSILRLFILKDRLVYSRLAHHPDPDLAARARSFAMQNEALYIMFSNRAENWPPDVVEHRWPEFRAALHELTDVIDARLAQEERELLPYLDQAPPATGETLFTRDWSAEEARLKALLEKTPVR